MVNVQVYKKNLQQPWGKIYYDILFDQLKGIKGQKILDFGSGFGIVANFLAKNNQVLAIEPNQDMVELCLKDYDYQQVLGSLEQLQEMADASFDMIFCHNVLEYVEQREHYLTEFSRLLKPKGRLSIVKHHEVGRIFHTVVFENDTNKALKLLSGERFETHSMGNAECYDLEQLINGMPLAILDFQGIRIFYGMQENSMKTASDWSDKLLQMELAVYDKSPYRDTAFFQHFWLEKKD